MASKSSISLRTLLLSALTCSLSALYSYAQEGADTLSTTTQSSPLFDIQLSTLSNASVGNSPFAPYYIASNSYGLTTQRFGIQEQIGISRTPSLDKRSDYGYGASLLAGYSSSVDYERWESGLQGFTKHAEHPARASVRELWAGYRYRSLYIWGGARAMYDGIFDSELGVGDIVMSNNARPIPQIRAGFTDFQTIPLTRDWVQIQGCIAYGKMMDSDWLKDHYSYYNSFITTGVYMHYARLYLRSNPTKPLSLTVGMQHASEYGGTWQVYEHGVETASHHVGVKFKDIINAFLPWTGGSSTTAGDQAYYSGNHLGSWDLLLDYRLPGDGGTLQLQMQSPWEDGSGIGKLNGWDGVWGLQYSLPEWMKSGFAINSMMVQYIDFTNQSGPMHWAPGDYPGTGVPSHASGADDYYNNYMYNGWAYYGMALGTPFIKSPIYNTDGYMRFTDNRVRGCQLGISGQAGHHTTWRTLLSYRTSWGTPFEPAPIKRHDTSMLLEALYSHPRIKGLSIAASLAWDAGTLYGNSLGALVAVSYYIPVHKR